MIAGGNPAEAAPLIGNRRRTRFPCRVCGVNFVESTKPVKNPICLTCESVRKGALCGGCGKEVVLDGVDADGRRWHIACAEAFGHSPAKIVLQPSSIGTLPALPAIPSMLETAGRIDCLKTLPSTASAKPSKGTRAVEPYGHMSGSVFSSTALQSYRDAYVHDAMRRAMLFTPEGIEQVLRAAGWTEPIDAALIGSFYDPEVVLKPPTPHLPHNSAFIYDSAQPPSKPFVSYSLEGIVRRIQAMGLLRERTWRFKTFKNVFIGRELVDYLLTTKQCSSRPEAVGIGQLLIQHGMIGTATGDKAEVFEDKDSAMYSVTLKRKRNARDDILADTAAAAVGAHSIPIPAATPSSTMGTSKRSFFTAPFKKTAAVVPLPPSAEITNAAPNSLDDDSTRAGGTLNDPYLRTIDPRVAESLDMSAEARQGVSADDDIAAARFVGINTDVSAEDGASSDHYHSDGSGTGEPHRALRQTKSASHLRVGTTLSPRHEGVEEDMSDSTPKKVGGSTPSKPAHLSRLSGAATLSDAVAEARRKLVTRRLELESKRVHEGWMVKQGHNFKTWKRRYFELTGYELSYYRKAPHPVTGLNGMIPARVIDIRDYTLEEAHVKRSPLSMRLVSKKLLEHEFLLYCETEADFIAWVKAISNTMRDFDELEKQWLELQGAPIRITETGTGAMTYSLLGNR